MRKGVAARVSESGKGATAESVAQILCIPDTRDARLSGKLRSGYTSRFARGHIARSTHLSTGSRRAPVDNNGLGAAIGAGRRDDGDLHGGDRPLDRRHCDADNRRRARRV